MATPSIKIDERMYSVKEVAEIGRCSPDYIRGLIEAGELQATQPRRRNGRPGQWLVYPKSLRGWLGVSDVRSERRVSKRAKQDAAIFAALCGK